DIVELRDEPLEIADAVAIGIVEGADEDLVERGPMHPLRCVLRVPRADAECEREADDADGAFVHWLARLHPMSPMTQPSLFSAACRAHIFTDRPADHPSCPLT